MCVFFLLHDSQQSPKLQLTVNSRLPLVHSRLGCSTTGLFVVLAVMLAKLNVPFQGFCSALVNVNMCVKGKRTSNTKQKEKRMHIYFAVVTFSRQSGDHSKAKSTFVPWPDFPIPPDLGCLQCTGDELRAKEPFPVLDTRERHGWIPNINITIFGPLARLGRFGQWMGSKCTEAECQLCADDTVIYVSNKTPDKAADLFLNCFSVFFTTTQIHRQPPDANESKHNS